MMMKSPPEAGPVNRDRAQTPVHVHPDRIRLLRHEAAADGPVVYWMSRDQRVADNWALLYACELGHQRKAPVAVVFSLSARFLGATIRQYDFMLRGLQQVEESLKHHGIAFFLLTGSPDEEMSAFVRTHRVGTLVTDFSPLCIHRSWKDAVARHLTIPFYEVDTHNVVPCWIASGKREFSAATMRPKIHRLLPAFLEDFPDFRGDPVSWKGKVKPIRWDRVRDTLRVDTSVQPAQSFKPGESEARNSLRSFLAHTLSAYENSRNDPTQSAQSNLSPYLHFGQIAPQRVVLEVMKTSADPAARDAFLEELIIRRELADNFCLYTPDYDSAKAFPSWARASLHAHRSDPRDYLYSRPRFEHATTHDPLWNAAQKEMIITGKMHGYLRMYWAKKILEWSPSPDDAMRTAVYLNDKYELDGRDPNGYAGIAWSIGGVHDRAWGDRKVFGKVRYMSYDGCRRKFDVEEYIARIEALSGNDKDRKR